MICKPCQEGRHRICEDPAICECPRNDRSQAQKSIELSDYQIALLVDSIVDHLQQDIPPLSPEDRKELARLLSILGTLKGLPAIGHDVHFLQEIHEQYIHDSKLPDP
jgi:hypothetical protein